MTVSFDSGSSSRFSRKFVLPDNHQLDRRRVCSAYSSNDQFHTSHDQRPHFPVVSAFGSLLMGKSHLGPRTGQSKGLDVGSIPLSRNSSHSSARFANGLIPISLSRNRSFGPLRLLLALQSTTFQGSEDATILVIRSLCCENVQPSIQVRFGLKSSTKTSWSLEHWPVLFPCVRPHLHVSPFPIVSMVF